MLVMLLTMDMICSWALFAKAGRAGWKAMIPVYSTYQFYDIGWYGRYCIPAMLIVGVVLGLYAAGNNNEWMMIPTIAISVLAGIFQVNTAINLAIRFDADTEYTIGVIIVFGVLSIVLGVLSMILGRTLLIVGLLVLPVIFKGIIAFGARQYQPDMPALM